MTNKPKQSCDSKAQAQACIKAIGDNERKIDKLVAKMNDELAKVSAKYAERITPLQMSSVSESKHGAMPIKTSF